MISVLLSAFNEAHNPFFWETLSEVKALQDGGTEIEVIIGVTPGTDRTLEMLRKLNHQFIEVRSSSRGERYNLALTAARANPQDWIILHHPRSRLELKNLILLKELPTSIKWGAFTHRFDESHPLLKFTSWWSNCIRGDLRGIYYLDHCLFVKRELLERVGGFPSVEIFEDTLLSLKLNHFGRPVRLRMISQTSAIRFRRNGLWRQACLNQILKLRFFSGAHHQNLNHSYEKDLNLN